MSDNFVNIAWWICEVFQWQRMCQHRICMMVSFGNALQILIKTWLIITTIPHLQNKRNKKKRKKHKGIHIMNDNKKHVLYWSCSLSRATYTSQREGIGAYGHSSQPSNIKTWLPVGLWPVHLKWLGLVTLWSLKLILVSNRLELSSIRNAYYCMTLMVDEWEVGDNFMHDW